MEFSNIKKNKVYKFLIGGTPYIGRVYKLDTDKKKVLTYYYDVCDGAGLSRLIGSGAFSTFMYDVKEPTPLEELKYCISESNSEKKDGICVEKQHRYSICSKVKSVPAVGQTIVCYGSAEDDEARLFKIKEISVLFNSIKVKGNYIKLVKNNEILHSNELTIFSGDGSLVYFESATVEQQQWIDACVKAKKWVKDPSELPDKVSPAPNYKKGDYIYVTPKSGSKRILLIENSVFSGDKELSQGVYINLDQKVFSRTYDICVWTEDDRVTSRLADLHEIAWLNKCIERAKYVDKHELEVPAPSVPIPKFPKSGWCEEGDEYLGQYLANKFDMGFKRPGKKGYAWQSTYWPIAGESSKIPYSMSYLRGILGEGTLPKTKVLSQAVSKKDIPSKSLIGKLCKIIKPSGNKGVDRYLGLTGVIHYVNSSYIDVQYETPSGTFRIMTTLEDLLIKSLCSAHEWHKDHSKLIINDPSKYVTIKEVKFEDVKSEEVKSENKNSLKDRIPKAAKIRHHNKNTIDKSLIVALKPIKDRIIKQ